MVYRAVRVDTGRRLHSPVVRGGARRVADPSAQQVSVDAPGVAGPTTAASIAQRGPDAPSTRDGVSAPGMRGSRPAHGLTPGRRRAGGARVDAHPDADVTLRQ